MMEIERNNQSVIARLIGFDGAPRQQQSVYGQQRVFSDNYLRKSVSIGSCENRASRIRRTSRPEIKKNLRNDDCQSTIVDCQTSGIIERNLGNVKHGSLPLFLRDSSTIFGWEFKRQLLERSKRSKVCMEIWSSKRDFNLGETHSMLDLRLKQRSELGTQVGIMGNEDWKHKSVAKLPILKHLDLSSSAYTKFKKTSKSDSRLRSYNKKVSANSKDVEFCVSFAKDLPFEEGFMPLNRIDMDDELSMNTGEAYQHSPNSVLEQDNSSSSEYGGGVSMDFHGLSIKLQILKLESEENQSKADAVTMSDGHSTERSSCVHENMEHFRCYGLKDSQQFSYLVNVLDKLGFHGEKLEVSFERWHSPEHIINPLVFETLENKYKKQESWKKSDRRLLFDRINFGLTEIVRSKPLRRKMSNFLRDIIAEELWNMLLSQEIEANADLSKKALGKEPWLELADEVDFIVGEIEAFLFNELVTELVAI